MLARVCLFTQRIFLAAWVGAAILFVVTSVAEQQFAGFGPGIRNQLALIRFPRYYAFGFAALGVSLLCGVLRVLSGRRDRLTWVALSLTAAATGLMIADFLWVYRPLAELMTDLNRPRDDTFRQYHQASKYINAVGVLAAGIATGVVCRRHPEPPGNAAEPAE